ncbi:glyoxal oxidase [Flammula alnicola]|nr:glyoxal oxidase [Flammula alnicola]
MKKHIYFTALVYPFALAQFPAVVPPPSQPVHQGDPGRFEIIADSLVSSQQIFLGRPDKIYILDKVENNPTQINGHPAWASEYGTTDNRQRAMDVKTNSFCAGGNVLGNGTWINVGGNQAVTAGGDAADSQDGSSGPYYDADGRRSIRILTPCSGDDCQWYMSPVKAEQRWYPTLETLEDGSIIIIGGSRNGGYINDAGQNNPTYEFFPPAGPSVTAPILQNTLPVNLYPLTWLIPSGKLLIQAGWSTVLLDAKTNVETPLDDMPDAVRTYPASAGTVMMPLLPANNWTATIMFCGGSNVETDEWTSPSFVPILQPASTSCVKITPDVSKSYVPDDPLPKRRSMANFVLLPDGKVLCLNGAQMGTAGYGSDPWAIGQSYADDPVLTPVIYDPDAPAGHRWSSDGFSASVVPRMYHSSAILLPDGSVFVSGSNPNADYTVGSDVKYPTEYRTERFYPSYYNQRRPQPKGLLSQLSYGGPSFDIVLDSDDLFGDVANVVNATVVIIRPGFSTHSINMGQRMVVLESTYTGYVNNTAILHVSQVPPNPAILAPGPALLFVVVKGVPSVGVQVMIGSGIIEQQTILPIGSAPASAVVQNNAVVNTTPSSSTGAPNATMNGSSSSRPHSRTLWLPMCIALTMTLAMFL